MENYSHNFMFYPLLGINIFYLSMLFYLKFTFGVLEKKYGEEKKPFNLKLLDNIIRAERPGLKGLILLATKKMVTNEKRTIIFFVILLGFIFFKNSALLTLGILAFFNVLFYLICKVELTKKEV